jgi:hypothetical protein
MLDWLGYQQHIALWYNKHVLKYNYLRAFCCPLLTHPTNTKVQYIQTDRPLHTGSYYPTGVQGGLTVSKSCKGDR